MRNDSSGFPGGLTLGVLLGAFSSALLGAPPANLTVQSAPVASGAPGLALPEVGETYSATMGFAKSWEEKKNPCGPWRYGWSDGLYGAFVLFPHVGILPYHNRQQEGWNDPAVDYVFTPSVRYNFGGDYDDGNVAYRAGAFILHGGGQGGRDYAHVIWGAPTDGRYNLMVVFEAQQHGINADAHILVSRPASGVDGPALLRLPGVPGSNSNVVSCYDTVLTQNRMTGNFSGNFTMSVGDTIDFAVGQNGDYVSHPGCIALYAVIQKQ